MSTDNIPKDVKLGIRLANTDSDAITHGGPDLTDASLMGDIRVKTGVKYEEITGVTAVNRGSDENINEMYTDISDNFERPIYIKKDGSGSFEIISRLATSGADSFNLEFCAKEYPMGVTTTTQYGSMSNRWAHRALLQRSKPNNNHNLFGRAFTYHKKTLIQWRLEDKKT